MSFLSVMLCDVMCVRLHTPSGPRWAPDRFVCAPQECHMSDRVATVRDGVARVSPRSSVCLIMPIPFSIRSSVRPAASSGSRSAVQTNRVPVSPAAKICADALWCVRPVDDRPDEAAGLVVQPGPRTPGPIPPASRWCVRRHRHHARLPRGAGGDLCTWINLRPQLWASLSGGATPMAGSTFYVDAHLDLVHRRLLNAGRTGDVGHAVARQLLDVLEDVLKQVGAGPMPAAAAPRGGDRAAVASASGAGTRPAGARRGQPRRAGSRPRLR